MIVIGLTGLARAGKDSVADILVRDYGFVKMSFAHPLKRMVKNLDPIVGFRSKMTFTDHGGPGTSAAPIYLSDLYALGMTDDDIKASPYGPEARRLWQRFGTDVMRAEQDDYWIQRAKREMLDGGHDRVVFTDCRFPNEADMIIGLEDRIWESEIPRASLWQVVRPGVELPVGAHASELWAGRLGEDVTINNDGTLDELREPISLALEYVYGRSQPEGWVHTGYLTAEGGLVFEGEK